MEKECIIVIFKKDNMSTIRIVGDKKLADDFVRSRASEILNRY